MYGSKEPTVEGALLALSSTVRVTTINHQQHTFVNERLTAMTTLEWEQDRLFRTGGPGRGARCDVSVALRTFDLAGLGVRGDALDPDADLRAMAEARRDLAVPHGVLLLLVPVGRDALSWGGGAALRRYGRARLPLLLQGYDLTPDPLNGWARGEEGSPPRAVLDADAGLDEVLHEPPLLLRVGADDAAIFPVEPRELPPPALGRAEL